MAEATFHADFRAMCAELDAKRPKVQPVAPRPALTPVADDGLTGRPILRGYQTVTPEMARRERSYWRRMAINRGECPDCGERDGRHEDGCPSAPETQEEEA